MAAYQDKHGRWRYRFTYQGERHSGSAPAHANTKKTALAIEKQLQEKLVARVFTGEMPTVAAFAARFLEYQRVETKPLTYELHETIIRLQTSTRSGSISRAMLDSQSRPG